MVVKCLLSIFNYTHINNDVKRECHNEGIEGKGICGYGDERVKKERGYQRIRISGELKRLKKPDRPERLRFIS
jgi:hypothetical protein